MKKALIITLSAIVCAFFTACTDHATDRETPDNTRNGGQGTKNQAAIPDDKEGTVAVDSKIHILPVEVYHAQPRTFQLHCQTERAYASGSNPIIFSTTLDAGTISISFEQVAETGMTCDIGPARACVDLGALEEGSYALALRNGGMVRGGRLTVTAGGYTFEMAENDVFGFTESVLNRIPKGTIFGKVSYMSDMTPTVADEFLTDLAAIGATRLRTPGYYREFSIDPNGDVVQPEPYRDHPRRERMFALLYAGDLSKVDGVMRKYLKGSAENYLYISVYADTGEQFLSWMYDRE